MRGLLLWVWSAQLVTRYLLSGLILVWLLSFVLPLDMALSNIPYFTIMYFEGEQRLVVCAFGATCAG